MLGETLSQPFIFLMLILFGFGSGIIFDISNFIWKLSKCNKVLKHFLDFFATIFVFIIFFVCILNFNYGELRFYEFLVFFAFFAIERFSIGKLVEKIISLCYNQFIKLVNKINFRGKKNDKKSS